MRTELMVDAMCWDLSQNVTAHYAYANKDFSYFCPHPDCLQEVRPKQIVNAHFFAPGMHVTGCPNEPEKVEGAGTALRPAKKASIVPPPAIPTELGPAGSRKEKRAKPTIAELFALADAHGGGVGNFSRCQVIHSFLFWGSTEVVGKWKVLRDKPRHLQ